MPVSPPSLALYSSILKKDTIKILKPGQSSTAATDDQKKLEEKWQRADTELYRILCTCLKKEGEGLIVYRLILKSKEGGYTNGSFKAAWNILINVFERTVKEDLRQLKT